MKPFKSACLPALALALFAIESPHCAETPNNRVASIYVAQDFINEQIALHSSSEKLVQKMNVELDPDHNQIILRGVIRVPLEELRAVNLDPKLGRYRFQVALHLDTTRQGHLILEFPLNQTFFYPDGSKDPKRDRVIIPVQMLSLALASARGYLAALSGDFEGFDRRTKKIEALIKVIDAGIAREKNPDALDDLKTQRESLRLQLQAVPIERKQLKGVSKEVETMLGFTGEKEISLNDELAAHDNALILKIKLSQLVPYLKGIELGGVRVMHDKKDGQGQNYFAIDVSAALAASAPEGSEKPAPPRPGSKFPPSLIMRLNQALFESEAVVAAEKKQMGSKLRDFEIAFKDDGLHVSGKWHAFLFSVPFDTIVDFVSTAPDTFEARVREVQVAGMDFAFLTKFVLESTKKRLDQSMQGICTFDYVGEEKDHSRALRVTVDPKRLVPAFPNLHLVAVDVRDREFLLKIGRTE